MNTRRILWQGARRLQPLLGWAPLRELASREYTDFLSTRTVARPHPYSLVTCDALGPAAPAGAGAFDDYVSWVSVTDRRYTGRHLPMGGEAGTPPIDAVVPLFERRELQPDARSNVLFMFFAQWFTDSLFRTAGDLRCNTSNHDIDLCQIYGLEAATTRALRSGQGGRLKSRRVGAAGDEYPDLLCLPGPGGAPSVRSEYQAIPYASSDERLARDVFRGFPDAAQRKDYLYAVGLDVGNSSIGYTAISTIFLREHNRLCEKLASEYGWKDDERLFQTARAINIVLLLKILVEDYINHILGLPLFLLQPGFAEARDWYRPNWMALEFNLLYRWHSLVPDALALGSGSLEPGVFRFNNRLLEREGVEAVFNAAAAQAAGRIGLQNTPVFLLPAERASLAFARRARLQPYNRYREKFDLPPLRSFAELTPRQPELAAQLQRLYGTVDQLEYVVGVFAEEAQAGSLFGDLMGRMVAYDALTQIYSNPLISRNVFNAATFTPIGLDTIADTPSFQALVERNITAARPRASLALAPRAAPRRAA
jgi:prostaglandin-endoperoxide synthase 2